jgi:hypothetical protein
MDKVQCIFDLLEEQIVKNDYLGLNTDCDKAFFGFELNFKNLLEFYLKSDDFTIISDIQNYYSGYMNPQNITTKDFLWISSQFDQALIHPFERLKRNPAAPLNDIFEPYIYRFSLNRPVKLMVSTDKDNERVLSVGFDTLYQFIKSKDIKKTYKMGQINQIIIKFRQIIRTINTRCYEVDKRNFKIENNYKILQFAKAINMVIDKYYPHIQKIDGYINDLDQKEIALIEFSKLLDSSSLRSSKVLGVEIRNFRGNHFKFDFPFNFLSTEEAHVDRYGVDYTVLFGNFIRYALVDGLKYQMIAKNGIKINYQDFDNNSIILSYKGTSPNELFTEQAIKFTGDEIDKTSMNWKNKYLKYKNKYLQLKKLLG